MGLPSTAGVSPRLRAWGAFLLPPREVWIAFVTSRLLIVLAAFVAESLIVRNPALTSGDDFPLLRSLTTWDAWYYLGIAREGYHADPVAGLYRDTAFPPFYPLLIRVLSAPWPAFAGLTAVVISNVAFLVALGLLVRLGEPMFGRRRAVLAASLLAIYPFASAFAMAYTESLFLMLAVGAFLAAERRQPAAAGVLVALATLCRLQGVVLILPLALVLIRHDRKPTPQLAWLLLAPLAAGAFMLYVSGVTGSTTAFLDSQTAWGRTGFGGAAPDETIAAKFSPYQAALIVTLCWSVFMLVWARRDKLRLEYLLVPILFIAAELSSGSLEAVGRVTMVAFPYAWLLANRRSATGRRMWPLLSAGLFTAIAVLSFGGYWVP